MRITDEAIREYMSLYQEDFGEQLSFEEAREIASRLVALYEVLCRSLPV